MPRKPGQKTKRYYTRDGIPRDAREWTKEDWRDLHFVIEFVKRRIRERHISEKTQT